VDDRKSGSTKGKRLSTSEKMCVGRQTDPLMDEKFQMTLVAHGKLETRDCFSMQILTTSL
jgi:hypothetical protein